MPVDRRSRQKKQIEEAEEALAGRRSSGNPVIARETRESQASRTMMIDARPGLAVQQLLRAGAAGARVAADVGVRAGDRGAAGRAGVVAAGAIVQVML